MITALRLLDFQKHKKLVLKLSPHVTTIVGESDKGKSSIIRALIWVLTNKPGGARFTRHGQERVRVDVKIDQHTLTRLRSGSKNRYTLDAEPYSAFKQDVPDTIKNLVRVGDLNIQNQHDAVFWFSEGRGEISRQLNQIVNLGDIDNALADVAQRLRTIKSKEDVMRERLDAARKEVKATEYIVEMALDLDRLEDAEQSIEARRAYVTSLRELIDIAKKSEQSGELGGRMWEDSEQLLKAADEVQKLKARVSALDERLTRADQAGNSLHTARSDYESMNSELDSLSGTTCPMCGGKGHL